MGIYLISSTSLALNPHVDSLQEYVCGRALDLLTLTKIIAAHLVPKAQVNIITSL